MWSSQLGGSSVLSAKLGLAARGRTAWVLHMHPLLGSCGTRDRQVQFTLIDFFFPLLPELQDVIFSRKATINIYKGQ